MPSLSEVQETVRNTVLGADAAPLKGIVADDRLGYAARVGVYRNNTTILLSEALGATFPIVRELVGGDFFANLCRAFVRTRPPKSPCLHEYGRDFADFIESVPGVEQLPYLADMARLEWAVNQALYAANDAPLDPTRLSEISADDYARLTFACHPATRVIRSAYPIHAIWALHQPSAGDDDRVDLDVGAEAVLVTRPGADVLMVKLSPGEAVFIQALVDGATLEAAFAMGGPDVDCTNALTTILTQGAFTDFALN